MKHGIVVVLWLGLAGCSFGPACGPLPEWVCAPGAYKGAKPGVEYFVGAGAPRQTRTLAAHSAAESAGDRVARYVGEIVGAKWQTGDRTKALPGRQSIVAVAAELARHALATGKAALPKPVQTHLRRVGGSYDGEAVEMYRIDRLYGVSTAQMVAIARAAASQVPDELRGETCEVRKTRLAELMRLLAGLSSKDFKL